MKIVTTKILSDEKWSKAEYEVALKEDGSIYIDAGCINIKKISIEFETNFSEKCIVCGDAWERIYADVYWGNAENRIMPWYCIFSDNDKIYCYGVETQPNAFCFWEYKNNRLTLILDVRNGNNGVSFTEKFFVAKLVYREYSGDLFSAASDFCRAMCPNPRLPKRPIFGGNDWYSNYGDNSFEKIIWHTERIAEYADGLKHRPYMIVDDGWQKYYRPASKEATHYNGGSWDSANEKFGDMGRVAEEIDKRGAIPGIWFRPLNLSSGMRQECFFDYNKGVLDPTVSEVQSYITESIKQFIKKGFKIIKHDFSSFDLFGRYVHSTDDLACATVGSFSDKRKTNAQIIKDFYRLIRNAAGDDCMLIGCNTFSHLSAGFFEIQRTGDDTSGVDWERTRDYGVNALAFRMPQHMNFYCADADCIGVTNSIDWNLNKQFLDVVSKSGTALFVSLARDACDNEKGKAISAAFEKCCENTKPSKPIDWTTNKTPRIWESLFGNDIYDWDLQN